MSRRNKENVNQLLELISRIPWWASLLCAALAYLVLHAVATAPLPKVIQPGQVGAVMAGSIWRGLAMAGQYVVPLLFALGALMSFVRRRQGAALVQQAAKTKSPDGLNQMSWAQFERMVSETLRRMGYQVVENGGGGADGGIDLHATKAGQRYIVQCKQWRTYRVGVAVVREHFGVITAERAAGGLIITSGRFTQDAIDFAAGKPITLVDGAQLHKTVTAVSKSDQPQMDRSFASRGQEIPKSATASAPSCPVCDSEMVLRQAKQGSKAGSSFWGCRQFPKCRGIRPAS